MSSLATSIWSRLPQRRRIRKRWFTFILYHRVAPETFSQHLDYLTRHYTLTNLDTLRDHYLEGAKLPPNPLFVTFDDGWKANYSLLDVITDRNVPVTVFLATGLIGGNKRPAPLNAYEDPDTVKLPEEPNRTMLDEQEIKEMSRTVNFQSHGVTHSPATALTPDRFKAELTESRETIESLTGKPVYAFAYPYNRAGRREANIVEEAGYTLARVGGRVMNTAETGRFLLNCIGVDENSTVNQLRDTLLRAELKTLLNKG